MRPAYWFFHSLSRLLAALFFQFRVYGREKIPQEGPVLLAMNHQSFLDPPLAGISTMRQVNFFARKTLLNLPVLKWILPRLDIIPVDKERPDMGALKSLIRVLKNGGVTCIFPEGTRSLDGHLQKALPGLGFVVAKTLTPVVPMRVFGSFEALPKNSKKVHSVPVTVVVGDPIYFDVAEIRSAEDKEKLYQSISERVMERIARLELPEERRGL